MELTEFLTWEFLSTMAGAVAATGIVTQFVKNIVPNTIPTRAVSYVTALVVILAAAFFTGTLTPSSGVLALFNAIVVSLAANGGYDAIVPKISK